MARVGSYSAKDIIRVLIKIGFVLKDINGSHYMYYNPRTGKKIPVPFHPGDLPRGTVHRIFKEAGLDYDTQQEL